MGVGRRDILLKKKKQPRIQLNAKVYLSHAGMFLKQISESAHYGVKQSTGFIFFFLRLQGKEESVKTFVRHPSFSISSMGAKTLHRNWGIVAEFLLRGIHYQTVLWFGISCLLIQSSFEKIWINGYLAHYLLKRTLVRNKHLIFFFL